MSKSSSGLFHSTQGIKEHYHENLSASDIIYSRVKSAHLDTRQHKLKYKLLSSKQRKALAQKETARTLSKNEYKHLHSNKRLISRRTEAINKFWEEERVRVAIGIPTRKWTKAQSEAILRGEKPKYKNKTIQGHHTYPVAKYPHLANRHEVIYPSTHREHLYGWHGGNYRNYKPGKKIHNITDF